MRHRKHPSASPLDRCVEVTTLQDRGTSFLLGFPLAISPHPVRTGENQVRAV
jgi:hypothetical protein